MTGATPLPARGAGSEAAGRADPAARNTSGVPDIARLVEDQFRMGFPHRIWVAGEVDEVGVARDGSMHFELTAMTEDGRALRLPAVLAAEVLPQVGDVLDRMHDADVEDLVCPGRLLRAGGLLRYDFAVHRLLFAVTALDPTTTSAGLASDREAVRQLVLTERLPERQRVLSPTAAPVRVAVVGRTGTPMLARVVERLRGCGYAVQIRVVPIGSQAGPLAEDLAAGVAAAGTDSDLILLVREEGRRLGLAPYDTFPLARAIAHSPVPVVTGLGDAGDVTVADEVAFEATPTALAAADAVVARLRAAEDRLRDVRDDVRGAGAAALDRAAGDLTEARDDVERAGAEAAARAAAAESRRWRWLLTAAVVVAVVLVAVAVLSHAPLVLIGLPVVAAGCWGLRWQRTSFRQRGGQAAMIPEVSFTEVLERLRRIREEMALTSSPEKVYRLGDEARRLVERGESVLGRSVDPTPLSVTPMSSPPSRPAEPTQPNTAARPESAVRPESGVRPESAVRPDSAARPDIAAGPDAQDTAATQVLPVR